MNIKYIKAPSQAGLLLCLGAGKGEVKNVNENNLIPGSQRSLSELRKIGAKGGRKSGESRRRKKSMREKMKILLSLPACDNDLEELKAIGIEIEDSDNEMVIIKGLFLKAATGDVSAIREIRNILGKDNSSEELALKKKELELKEKQQSGDTDEGKMVKAWIEALVGDEGNEEQEKER